MCILLTRGLVVVDVDALQLQIRGATVVAQGVDSMLVGDDLPELPTRKFQSLLRVHIAFSRRFLDKFAARLKSVGQLFLAQSRLLPVPVIITYIIYYTHTQK